MSTTKPNAKQIQIAVKIRDDYSTNSRTLFLFGPNIHRPTLVDSVLSLTTKQEDGGEEFARHAVRWLMSQADHAAANDELLRIIHPTWVQGPHFVVPPFDRANADRTLVRLAKHIDYERQLRVVADHFSDDVTLPGHEYTLGELRESLRAMSAASAAFYKAAIAQKAHAFIEFTGLMNTYIKVCTAALADGVPFWKVNKHSGQAFRMKGHEVEYLAEKFECIFGDSLAANPDHLATFITKGLGVNPRYIGPEKDKAKCFLIGVFGREGLVSVFTAGEDASNITRAFNTADPREYVTLMKAHGNSYSTAEQELHNNYPAFYPMFAAKVPLVAR